LLDVLGELGFALLGLGLKMKMIVQLRLYTLLLRLLLRMLLLVRLWQYLLRLLRRQGMLRLDMGLLAGEVLIAGASHYAFVYALLELEVLVDGSDTERDPQEAVVGVLLEIEDADVTVEKDHRVEAAPHVLVVVVEEVLMAPLEVKLEEADEVRACVILGVPDLENERFAQVRKVLAVAEGKGYVEVEHWLGESGRLVRGDRAALDRIFDLDEEAALGRVAVARGNTFHVAQVELEIEEVVLVCVSGLLRVVENVALFGLLLVEDVEQADGEVDDLNRGLRAECGFALETVLLGFELLEREALFLELVDVLEVELERKRDPVLLVLLFEDVLSVEGT